MAARAGDEPAGAPGLLIEDRYQLDQVRSEHRPQPHLHTVLWRATDTALGRSVAVLLVSGLNQRDHKALTATAARASQVADSRFVRILDVGRFDTDPTARSRTATTWIATEWVDAPSLADAIRREPLPTTVATEVARQCAEALDAAARQGVTHGRLHPGQILLPAGGLPRITGLGVAAELAGQPATESREDVRALGAVLFAALTGRWPLPDAGGLPPADSRTAQAARPRLIRAGIGRELDETTHRMLTGAYADLHACVRALSALPSRALDAPPDPPPLPGGATLRRWAWRVVPPLVVLAIGLAGWAVGSDLGRVPTAARQPHTVLPPAHAAAPGSGSARLVWAHPPVMSGFDPEGDGEENDDAAPLAVDRDPTTTWTTDSYRGDSHLGGLKSGVGLLLDLGRRRSVSVAELALTAAGADVEIRAGNSTPATAADLSLVATRDGAPTRTRIALAHPTRARYWLVWFTNLPKDAGGYRVGVAEVALLG